MRTIVKIYKKDCQPCLALGEVLTEVGKDEPFNLIELDIASTEFKVRKEAKGILMKYATTNIPFVLFRDEQDKDYAAHYYEAGPATVELIKQKLHENN